MLSKRVLLFTALAHRGVDAVKCVQCVESRDHDGNPASGTSDTGCFDASDLGKYEAECPPGQNYCGSEIVIDWFPRGWQHVTVRRDCRVDPVGDGCYSSTLTGFAYKDCVATCEGDNCNDNNDAIFDKAAEKEDDGSYRDISCFSCNSDYDEQDGVDGNPYCYSTPPDQPVGKKCPIYANAGCFNSRSVHAKEGNDTDVAHYFKGCSTFGLKEGMEENEAECVDAEFNGDKILMCDAVCSGEKDAPCNGGVTGGANRMCYTCEASINQEGAAVGVGDLACFDRPQNYHLEVCADHHDQCVTEFRVDWQLQGEQVYTMRRLCGSSSQATTPETKEDCLMVGNRNLQSKQCYETCEGDSVSGCNGGNDIFKKFSTKKVNTCRVCSDHIYGTGNKEDCADDESTNKACPEYADAACFSSRLVEDTNTAEESFTYHGCSTFRTSNDKQECNTVTVDNENGQPISIKESCKKSCTKDECNKDALKVNKKEHYCAVCSVTVNHFNRTVGEGDIACWGEDSHHKFNQACPSDTPMCVTDIEVDWMPKGDQLTTVRRACAPELTEPSCRSGAISTWQYKDCQTTCDDNGLHPCNTGMYETALLFHERHNHPHHCFNCESHHYPTKGQCPKDMTTPEAQEFITQCPVYALEGCFTTITQLTDYGNKYPDDVIRGCSTFEQEFSCSAWSERYFDESTGEVSKELKWNSCKESCHGPHCNDQPATVPDDNRCFVCSAQRDSQGNRVGLGNQRCFDDKLIESNSEMVFECGRDEYCVTDLEVDWIGKGDQIQSIRRACAAKEAVDYCETTVTDTFVAKDCYTTCEGALCNDDIDVVARLYEPKEGGVSQCYSCQFDELSGGKIDSQNCKTGPPTEATIKECPRWASSACFVADLVVPQVDSELVRIYRGCSSFGEDLFGAEQRCSTLTVQVQLDGEADMRDASACKGLCASGDACNNDKYPDYVPPSDEECPPCDDAPTDTPPTDEPGTDSTVPAYVSFGLLTLVSVL